MGTHPILTPHNRGAVADQSAMVAPRNCMAGDVIRVLYGRMMVEDDGYPGLRFAYPGLNASPLGSASHASHVLTTDRCGKLPCRGVSHTPGIRMRKGVDWASEGRDPGGRMPTGFSRG